MTSSCQRLPTVANSCQQPVKTLLLQLSVTLKVEIPLRIDVRRAVMGTLTLSVCHPIEKLTPPVVFGGRWGESRNTVNTTKMQYQLSILPSRAGDRCRCLGVFDSKRQAVAAMATDSGMIHSPLVRTIFPPELSGQSVYVYMCAASDKQVDAVANVIARNSVHTYRLSIVVPYLERHHLLFAVCMRQMIHARMIHSRIGKIL